jgi:hypothetical protein
MERGDAEERGGHGEGESGGVRSCGGRGCDGEVGVVVAGGGWVVGLSVLGVGVFAAAGGGGGVGCGRVRVFDLAGGEDGDGEAAAFEGVGFGGEEFAEGLEGLAVSQGDLFVVLGMDRRHGNPLCDEIGGGEAVRQLFARPRNVQNEVYTIMYGLCKVSLRCRTITVF